MAIDMYERFVSPETLEGNGREDKAMRAYHLLGDAGETEAQIRAYAKANIPAFYEGLTRKDIRFTPEETDKNLWLARAQYTSPEDESNKPTPNPGEGYLWTIKSGGGATVRQLYSLGIIDEVVATGYSDWAVKNASGNVRYIIGWEETAEGGVKANGTDLDVGGVEIGVRYSVSAADVTAGFLVSVAGYAALRAVNLNAWNGFAAKTLRLINYSASERNSEGANAWDIQLDFNFSPFQQVQMQGLQIDKQGQHLLDVTTQYKKVDASDLALPDIIRLATHKVRPEIDYATALKLSTPFSALSVAGQIAELERQIEVLQQLGA